MKFKDVKIKIDSVTKIVNEEMDSHTDEDMKDSLYYMLERIIRKAEKENKI